MHSLGDGKRARVLLTGERATNRRLRRLLSSRQVEAVELPCLRIEPPSEPDALRSTLRSHGAYDWIVVTSRHGAEALIAALGEAPPAARLAAVGPATAKVLTDAGYRVDLVPEKAKSQALLEALIERGAAGASVLLALGNLADDRLESGLVAAGARAHRVEAYRTVEEVDDPQLACRLVTAPPSVGAIALMSPSALRALHRAVGLEALEVQDLVCIGPTTAAAVERLGLQPKTVASPHTLEGLADSLISVCLGR